MIEGESTVSVTQTVEVPVDGAGASITGTVVGGMLVGLVSAVVLIPLRVLLFPLSAMKVDDRAFAILKRYSQDTNTKLRDVAQQLVDTRTLPRPNR